VLCNATDASGNVATRSFAVVVRDATPPTVEITSPSVDATLTAPTADVLVQTTDVIGVFAVTVNGVVSPESRFER
jgi:hypothetical protein